MARIANIIINIIGTPEPQHNMRVVEKALNGVIVLEPEVFTDERGQFFVGYDQGEFATLGITESIVQLNQSVSKATVLRGLHFQKPPYAQSKIVRCLRGKLFDVVVDLRIGSPTFGQWHGTELAEDNHRLLYVPRGFAHGFQALTDCEMIYLCGHASYQKNAEAGLLFSDPAIGIVWPLPVKPRLNARDGSWPRLSEFSSPFTYEIETL